MMLRAPITYTGVLLFCLVGAAAELATAQVGKTAFREISNFTDADETLDAERQLPRLDLEFESSFKLAENSAGIDPPNEAVEVSWPGVLTPRLVVSIPAGCFEPDGVQYIVNHPEDCGVALLLQPARDSVAPPEDLTAGILSFDARLVNTGAQAWTLKLNAIFLDVRDRHVPSLLAVMGGSEVTVVTIGDEYGEASAAELQRSIRPNNEG